MRAVSWGSSCRTCATVSKTRPNLGRVALAFKRARSAALRIGLEPRPLALDELHLLPQRIGHHQDVGEQDRRIEAVAPDRLQRHLGRQLRRVAQVEEAAGLARAPRDTRAGSARPAASARSAAATAASPANTRSRRGRMRDRRRSHHVCAPIQRSRSSKLLLQLLGGGLRRSHFASPLSTQLARARRCPGLPLAGSRRREPLDGERPYLATGCTAWVAAGRLGA